MSGGDAGQAAGGPSQVTSTAGARPARASSPKETSGRAAIEVHCMVAEGDHWVPVCGLRPEFPRLTPDPELVSCEACFDAMIIPLLAELARGEMERTAAMAELRIGPFSAFTLIGILQLAWRNPGLKEPQKDLIRGITEQLEPHFGGWLAVALERGWDTSFDRDPAESEQ